MTDNPTRPANGRRRGLGLSLCLLLLSTSLLAAAPTATSRSSSQNVAFIGSEFFGTAALARLWHSHASFAGFTFTNVAPSTIATGSLDAYDTVVLNSASPQMGCSTTPLSAGAKAEIKKVAATGRKVILYDSECPTAVDYTWLPFPFTTSNPGNLNAVGLLGIVEENTLSCSVLGTPCHIDTAAVASNTDAAGDAIIATTTDWHWCKDIDATNGRGQQGTVHMYANVPGGGLYIYNGLSMRDISSTPAAPYGTANSHGHLTKIWLQELLQPWHPSGLPCSRTVASILPCGPRLGMNIGTGWTLALPAPGTVDPRWTVTTPYDPSSPGPAYNLIPSSHYATPFWNGWIGPSRNDLLLQVDPGPGQFIFRTQISMPQGALRPEFDIPFAADDSVEFFLNGHSIGGYGTPGTVDPAAYQQLHPLSAHTYVLPGSNILEARVDNVEGPVALLVTGNVSWCFESAVPHPPDDAGIAGHKVTTFEYVTASYFDFKDGVGIADPNNESNPCTALLLGLRGIQPLAETWELDQNMGTNLNGPGVGVSNLVPPLSPAGGWLPASGGVNLGTPCPAPGSGTGSLWLVWNGMNWRSAQADSSTQISLCTEQTFASSSPGCLSVPGANLALIAAACANGGATFGHNYLDNRGKSVNGQPFDIFAMKNDQIACATRHAHDYTNTVQDFAAGSAGQTFDIIKNEAVVHAGSGTTYMAVCWSIDYVDFTNPLAPVNLVAEAHDWKLIVDLSDPAGAAGMAASLRAHYGEQKPGDSGAGGATVALRGFYSGSGTGIGQNGFGPCPTSAALPEGKKPSPLV